MSVAPRNPLRKNCTKEFLGARGSVGLAVRPDAYPSCILHSLLSSRLFRVRVRQRNHPVRSRTSPTPRHLHTLDRTQPGWADVRQPIPGATGRTSNSALRHARTTFDPGDDPRSFWCAHAFYPPVCRTGGAVLTGCGIPAIRNLLHAVIPLTIVDDRGGQHQLQLRADGILEGDTAFLFSVYGRTQGNRRIDHWRRAADEDALVFFGDFELRARGAFAVISFLKRNGTTLSLASATTRCSRSCRNCRSCDRRNSTLRIRLLSSRSDDRIRYVTSIRGTPLLAAPGSGGAPIGMMRFGDKVLLDREVICQTGLLDGSAGRGRCVSGWMRANELGCERPEWPADSGNSPEVRRLAEEMRVEMEQGFLPGNLAEIHETTEPRGSCFRIL